VAKNSKGIEVAAIDAEKCIGCQICIGECPVGAIELSGAGVAQVEPETCIGCGKCSEVCPVDAVVLRKEKKGPRRRKKVEVGPGPPSPSAGVAVFIEVDRGAGAQVSWELVGKARELAAALNAPVMGFLLGRDVQGVARDVVAYGCDEVHCIDHPLLGSYLPLSFGKALTHLCETLAPEILLIGATHLGRDLAGVAATLLKTGLTADCTGLAIEEETGLLLMTRPTFGGNIMATIFCEQRRPQMSSVRPGVMRCPDPDPERKGIVRNHHWTPPAVELPTRVQWIPHRPEETAVDIVQSPALVVAGRGACDPGSFHLLEELAQAVGGTIACSRPVVESGLLPYERQVGQTGKTVAPRLYIGVGVSGAIQHLVAIQGAEKIIAVNSDPNAPIFKVADVGLVGDYQRVVPQLTAQFRKRMG